MHIVFISQIIPYPPHGGVLQRGFNLLRELGKRHVVDLLAYIHPDALHREKDLVDSRQVLSQFCRSVEYFSLWPKRSRLHKFAAFMAAIPYPMPFSVLAHRSRELEQRLSALLNMNKPDIVHLDTIALAPLSYLCGNIPVALSHHNVESVLMRRRAAFERSPVNRWFVALQAQRLAAYEYNQTPRFALNVMVSEADARHLEQMVPGIRTWVVENGVDTEYFRPREEIQEQALIYTGGMNMFANRDAVLWFLKEIWPQLKYRKPGIRFYVIGQDPPPEILEIAASDKNIDVTGYVEDVRPWVAKAAVYIVPLRVGGGTRLKVVDAMAQGKAIVSTTVGCEGIRVTDGLDILIADDPGAFANKVLTLLADRVRRDAIGKSARELVEQKYAWSILGRKLEDGYQKVLTNRGAPGHG